MMSHYLETKKQSPDCILFYRLGDFYEMFFDDALTASKELEITLTGKDCGLEERAPMCGVPYHAADMYIKRLIDMGFNQKQAVGILYVISAILGLCAVVLTTSGAIKAMVLLCALCLAGLFAYRVSIGHTREHGETRPEDREQLGKDPLEGDDGSEDSPNVSER